MSAGRRAKDQTKQIKPVSYSVCGRANKSSVESVLVTTGSLQKYQNRERMVKNLFCAVLTSKFMYCRFLVHVVTLVYSSLIVCFCFCRHTRRTRSKKHQHSIMNCSTFVNSTYPLIMYIYINLNVFKMYKRIDFFIPC